MRERTSKDSGDDNYIGKKRERERGKLWVSRIKERNKLVTILNT